MTGIVIVPLDLEKRFPLDRLSDDLTALLGLPARIVAVNAGIEAAFDPSRRQYHSGQLLARLLTVTPDGPWKVLGITSRDLFLPILTYVFGQAQLGNRAAVFSTHRLRNEFYGLPPSESTWYDRSLKEALHELGHTFGLRHCADHPCAMNASTYVEDIDLKPPAYCRSCGDQVRAAVASPPEPQSV